MRVPVRRLSQTRVSERQQGYARGVTPLDVSPLTNLVEGFRDQLLDEQDARQRVELNRRLLREVNELQSDFEERRRNPEVSPIDFADTTNTAYTERHTTLLDELRRERFSPELLEDFENRLGTVRQGFFERGLGHQLTQLRARAVDQIEDTAVQASQYAAANPVENYATARDMVIESIRNNPDLTEDERDAAEDEQLVIVRDGAARALAIQNPQLVIDTLDPQGLTAPSRAAPAVTPTASSAGDGGDYTPNPGADRIMNYQARAAGFQSVPTEVQTLGQASDFATRVNRAGVPSSAMGLYQITGDTLRDFAPRVFGTDWRNEAFTPAAQERIAEAIFNSARGSAAALSGRWVSLTRAEAERVRQMPWAQARIEIMRGESGGRVQSAVAPSRAGAPMAGGSQLTDEVTPIDLPASTVRQQSDATLSTEPTMEEQARAAGVPASTDISAIRTGNALIDDLNGRERIQLLSLAREQMNRVTATQRAEMDVRIGNITAEAMNNGGEIAAPIPTEQEVLQVYGAIEGPQRWAQIQQSRDTGRAITTFRTQSATDIQTALDALEPDPGSPTYATELQIYQGAQRAAQALLTQRQQDPAAYAMQHFPSVREAAGRSTAHYYAELDRVYEILGINSDTAPVMSAEATERLNQQYREMSPSQRREFMRQNMGEMGEDRFRRFVRDMEGTTAESDARIYELLRTYPGSNGQVSNLFHRVLEGREIIATDPARRPNPQQVLTLFRQYGLDAIRRLHPRSSQAIQEAAEALYVQRGGDPVDVAGNSRVYKEALAEVLGGSLPADMRRGQVRDFTILPPRTNERQFQNWIERQSLVSLTNSSVGRRPPRYGDLRTAVPIQDIVEEGVFVMVAPGQYMIYMESDGRPLGTSTGAPFVVNVDPREVVRSPVGRVRTEPLRGGVM